MSTADSIALHRFGSRKTFEYTERVERAVDRALDAEGWSISDLDLREIP